MVDFVEKLSDLEQLRDIWAAGGKVVIQADEPAELPPSFDSAASSISTTTQQSCKRQRMQSDSAQSQGVSSKNPPSVLPLSVCCRSIQYIILCDVPLLSS